MKRYIIETTFDTTVMIADMSQASAPIMYEGEDGEEICTPYQTADARHDLTEAAVLIYRYLGSDFWLNPDDEAPEDEDAYIRDLIVSVEPEEEEEEEEKVAVWLGYHASIWKHRGYEVCGERVILGADDDYSEIISRTFNDDDLIEVDCNGDLYYYADQDAADRDQDGSSALAVVTFG